MSETFGLLDTAGGISGRFNHFVNMVLHWRSGFSGRLNISL
jgi:hypothetical protein